MADGYSQAILNALRLAGDTGDYTKNNQTGLWESDPNATTPQVTVVPPTGDDSDDEDQQAAAPAPQAPVAAPAPAAPTDPIAQLLQRATAPPTPISQRIQDLASAAQQVLPSRKPAAVIDFSGNRAASPENVNAAIQQSAMNTLGAQLGKSADLLAGGIARTGGPSAAQQIYSDQEKNANLPLQELATKMEMEKQDPNSAYSKGLRNFVSSQYGVKIGDNTAATDLDKVMPLLSKSYEADLTRQGKLADIVLGGAERAEQAEESAKGRELQAAAVAASRENIAGQKVAGQATQKQQQAFNQTQQLLESARGNPEVSQAMKDRLAVAKAQSLIPADPNQMSPQQISLLASEIGKIATGGVPAVAELKDLNPSTLPKSLAGIAQKVLNQPTPANYGDFVKQYQSYLGELGNIAQKTIDNKYTRILDSRKDQLGEQNYNNLHDQYFSPMQQLAHAQQASNQPQDPKIAAYAQAHSLNYDVAKKILEQRGYSAGQ